jgi:hypothetical protein
MLPQFPKARKQMIKIRDAKFWEGYYSASPILSQIRVRPQRDGRDSSFQDEQGNIQRIDYQKASVTTWLKLEEACGMTIEAFTEHSKETGFRMGSEAVRQITEKISKAAKETGNVFAYKGGPITPSLFLEILEKVIINFAVDGTPIWPSFDPTSQADAQVQSQWPEWLEDQEFQTRLKKIIKRKREEFYAREACRRLVD